MKSRMVRRELLHVRAVTGDMEKKLKKAFKAAAERWEKELRSCKTEDEFIEKVFKKAVNPIYSVKGIEEVISGVGRAFTAYDMPLGLRKELFNEVLKSDISGYMAKVNREVGDDILKQMSRMVSEKKPYTEMMTELPRRYESLSTFRSRTIVRTEMLRAGNMVEYQRGLADPSNQYFRVISHPNCCPECAELYGYGESFFRADEVDKLPPLHPNCRCVVDWPSVFDLPPELQADVLGVVRGDTIV